jgi:hypothetical protein
MCVDSHANETPNKEKEKPNKIREWTQEGSTSNHGSSSSSFSASPSNPPYRPCGAGAGAQSPLGRGRKLSLRARFALRATACGFLDVDVPSPEPTLRVRCEPETWRCAPLAPSGSLDGGRPIPSEACCRGTLADTARDMGTGRTDARTGTGMAILLVLGGWPLALLAQPLAERGTKDPDGTFVAVSASRGRLLGTDCERPMLDAGRTAGVIVPPQPFPGAEPGVVARGGTEPPRVFVPPRRFSLSAAPVALSRICSMLSLRTRKGRPASASQAGIEASRSFSIYGCLSVPSYYRLVSKKNTHPWLLFLNALAHLFFSQEPTWVSWTSPKESALI